MSDELTVEEMQERIIGDRQWPVRITLKHPIDRGSERITCLEFRRGRMGDMKGVPIDGVPRVEQLMLIASRMCGQPIDVIESLADEDGAEVMAIALGFFRRSLLSGKRR
jgi:hypothetical protein